MRLGTARDLVNLGLDRLEKIVNEAQPDLKMAGKVFQGIGVVCRAAELGRAIGQDAVIR